MHVMTIIIITIATSLNPIGCIVKKDRCEVEKLIITISTMFIIIKENKGLFFQIGCFQGFDW